MGRADRIHAALKRRIEGSPHQVTVVYPAVRPVLTGFPPTTAPVGPLTGPKEQPAAVPGTTPTASKPPVTVRCLWYDAYGNFVISMQGDQVRSDRIGWRADANALARVLVEDAALDPAVAPGDTIFKGALYVEHLGRRYEVVAVDPIGSGDQPAYCYHVWLQGNT